MQQNGNGSSTVRTTLNRTSTAEKGEKEFGKALKVLQTDAAKELSRIAVMPIHGTRRGDRDTREDAITKFEADYGVARNQTRDLASRFRCGDPQAKKHLNKLIIPSKL